MGGLLLKAENRGALVPTRTLYAHQLSRATWSNSGSQNLCEGQDCNVDPAENRQHHSKRSMDVMPWKGIFTLQQCIVADTESR